ncbi:MAG: GGDEF domain-containing protein [Pseudomonadota bacterium]
MMRANRASLVFAASYTVGAVAFFVDVLFQHSTSVPIRTTVAGLYAVTAILLVCGIWRHYRGPAPWRALVGLLIVHLAVYASLLSLDTPWIRSLSVNFGCGMIFLFGVAAMKGRQTHTFDTLLYCVHITNCVLCFARPVVVALFVGEPITSENHSEELLLVSLHLFAAAAAVVTGMLLLAVLSHDIFEELRESSITDPLTGLLNRRGLDIAANKLVSKVPSQRFTMVIADLDHFKAINDSFGHAAGDHVIASVGQIIRNLSRKTGTVGRIGGEEFVVLLPDSKLVDAVKLAEQTGDALRSLRVENVSPYLSVTASFGVAEYCTSEDLSSLFMRADHALYLAKSNGRDCVRSEADLAVHDLAKFRQGDKIGSVNAEEAFTKGKASLSPASENASQ